MGSLDTRLHELEARLAGLAAEYAALVDRIESEQLWERVAALEGAGGDRGKLQWQLDCPACGATLIKRRGQWHLEAAAPAQAAQPAPQQPLLQVARDHAEGHADKYGCLEGDPDRMVFKDSGRQSKVTHHRGGWALTLVDRRICANCHKRWGLHYGKRCPGKRSGGGAL